MVGELTGFLSKHEDLLGHVMASEMFPVFLDLFFEQMMTYIVQASKKMEFYSTDNPQKIEGMAAFYAGGILHLLKHWTKQKDPSMKKVF